MTPTPKVEPAAPAEPEAIAQLRHLVDDLVVAHDDEGLVFYAVHPRMCLAFSNMVSACKHLLAALGAGADKPEPSAWRIEYGNDTGPSDEGFWEWWDVTDGLRSFKCDSEDDAKWLALALGADAATLDRPAADQEGGA